MKSILFTSAFLLLLQTIPAFADTPPGPSPSVTFAPGISSQIFGTGTPEAKKNALSCDLLINQTWPYPNAQVTGICQDATTSCIRYKLIQKNQEKAKEGRLNTLKTNLPVAYKDAEMKILGCVVAIEATISGDLLLNNTSGNTTVGGGSGGY